MASWKQMAGAVFATFLLFAASATALPTAEDIGLPPQANQPLSCFTGSDVVADQGWEMWMNAEAFCKKSNSAIIPANGSITSPSYQAHVNYYSLEVANQRCETQPVNADECIGQLKEILFNCNIGVNEGSVGGSVSTDCGYIALKPSVKKLDPPTSESNEAVLDARDIYPDGCNPPVWSACTSSEKSALLANACDFSLCLMAGNCTPC